MSTEYELNLNDVKNKGRFYFKEQKKIWKESKLIWKDIKTWIKDLLLSNTFDLILVDTNKVRFVKIIRFVISQK